MAVNSEAIAKTPVTVEQLAENITLVKKLQEKMRPVVASGCFSSSC